MRRATRLVLTAALAATSAAGLAVPQALTTSAAASTARVDDVRLNGFEARLAADINAARRTHGLRPLVVVAGATDVARRWSWRLARAQRLWHNPSIVRDLQDAGSGAWTEIAENVGFGPSTDPQALFQAYMQSPEHRANILDPAARYLGDGTVERDGVAYNTLDFTNAYSSSYGRTRVPAAGLTMDGNPIMATTDVATFESGFDQRLTTRGYGAVRSAPVGFTGPGGGNDAAVAVLRRAGRGAGHGVLLMRDALDLAHTTHLCVQLAARDARGRSVPVQVVLRRSFGGQVTLGVVRAGRRARWADFALPAGARDFRNTLAFRVSGLSIRHAGGRVRLALYDVRADV
jgi:uncharacterized protein YkwD